MTLDIVLLLNPKKLALVINRITQNTKGSGITKISFDIEDYPLFYRDSKKENPISEYLSELVSYKIIESFTQGDAPKDVYKTGNNTSYSDDFIESYMNHAGYYEVVFIEEKIQLFIQIINNKQKYLCNLKTIKYLFQYSNSLDLDCLIDYLSLEERYIFKDNHLLLLSIATSTRRNIAKMFDYFIKNQMDFMDIESFKEELKMENHIVIDNTDYEYNDFFGIFYFDEVNDDAKDTKEELIYGNISYNFKTFVLCVEGKFISFKGANKQRKLLEYLIHNHNRFVNSEELRKYGITDLKSTYNDLKEKISITGVSELQIKMLFKYFEDGATKYCRILL